MGCPPRISPSHPLKRWPKGSAPTGLVDWELIQNRSPQCGDVPCTSKISKSPGNGSFFVVNVVNWWIWGGFPPPILKDTRENVVVKERRPETVRFPGDLESNHFIYGYIFHRGCIYIYTQCLIVWRLKNAMKHHYRIFLFIMFLKTLFHFCCCFVACSIPKVLLRFFWRDRAPLNLQATGNQECVW